MKQSCFLTQCMWSGLTLQGQRFDERCAECVVAYQSAPAILSLQALPALLGEGNREFVGRAAGLRPLTPGSCAPSSCM